VVINLRAPWDSPNVRFGSKADIAMQNGMSALTPKADMCGAPGHVRFVPIADIRSFDEHVHAAQKCFWNRQAYGLRSLEIDYQLELRGLLYR
jgi:hypothetical protein